MPKLLYSVRTPLGEFASTTLAAKAHKVDRSTILNRCETLPDQYQKIPVEPKPKAPRKAKYWVKPKITAHTWPMTWYQYKWLPEDVKEEIWQAWCDRNDQDPDSESAVTAFFDEMDQTPEPTDQEITDDEQQVV